MAPPGGCLRMLLIALVVLGVPYTGYRLTVKALIRAELKAVSAAGYPATTEELKWWYPGV